MQKTLEQLKAEWEKDSLFIAEFGSEKSGTVIRVIKMNEYEFCVIRYFSLGTTWAVSLDGDHVYPERAMQICAEMVNTLF